MKYLLAFNLGSEDKVFYKLLSFTFNLKAFTLHWIYDEENTLISPHSRLSSLVVESGLSLRVTTSILVFDGSPYTLLIVILKMWSTYDFCSMLFDWKVKMHFYSGLMSFCMVDPRLCTTKTFMNFKIKKRTRFPAELKAFSFLDSTSASESYINDLMCLSQVLHTNTHLSSKTPLWRRTWARGFSFLVQRLLCQHYYFP